MGQHAQFVVKIQQHVLQQVLVIVMEIGLQQHQNVINVIIILLNAPNGKNSLLQLLHFNLKSYFDL